MKNRIQNGFSVIEMMIVCAIIALMAAVSVPQVKGQLTAANTGNALTNGAAGQVFTTTSTNLIASGAAAVIPLRRGYGLALYPYYGGTQSTNTGNLGFQLQLTWDNTNYTTTKPLTMMSTANGTTAVLDWYYWPWTTLGGALSAKVGTVTQAVANVGNNNTLTISNIMWINDR